MEEQCEAPPGQNFPLDDLADLNLFDTAHFLTATQDYECPICLNVLKQPEMANNATDTHEECLHVYCSSCIRRALETAEVCPLDRKTLTLEQLTPLKFLQGKIGGLNVKCVLHDRGCKWTNTFGRQGKNLSKHLDTCDYAIVGCRHDECERHIPRADKEAHEAQCGKLPAPCPLCELVLCVEAHAAHQEVCPRASVVCAECKASVVRENMDAHVAEECPRRLIPCLLGCRIHADAMTQHMQEAAPQHIAILCARLSQQQGEYATLTHALGERLNQQQLDHATLKQDHAALKQEHEALKQQHAALEQRVDGMQVVTFHVGSTNVTLRKFVRLAGKPTIRCDMKYSPLTRAVRVAVGLAHPLDSGTAKERVQVQLLGPDKAVLGQMLLALANTWLNSSIGTLPLHVTQVVLRFS